MYSTNTYTIPYKNRLILDKYRLSIVLVYNNIYNNIYNTITSISNRLIHRLINSTIKFPKGNFINNTIITRIVNRIVNRIDTSMYSSNTNKNTNKNSNKGEADQADKDGEWKRRIHKALKEKDIDEYIKVLDEMDEVDIPEGYIVWDGDEWSD